MFVYLLKSLVLILTLSFTANAQAVIWKSLFVAGDDSIENFDNGREDLSLMLSKLGTLEQIHLSTSKKYVSPDRGVHAATSQNIVAAFKQMTVKQDEGCLVHMTSHGAKAQGFYLKLSGILAPADFSKLVNQACGTAPTVILISACYSGQFITDDLKGPNRVIMTAARPDRPSFGCSADTEYTYWDHCLLDEVPKSKTWIELQKNVSACISTKEQAMGVRPSEPQAYFGTNAMNWELLKN